ncbi:AAA family ATPase [Streptomyces sp. AC536]|uniref:AAA family ATPase n=1 Tax=Streptomyces buecherae TaxID=2763006 RepID=UPI00164D39FB|nr:AAA family ATPase [Streptomyces buecherae]MBC3981831.1 AAA family ATPase [Streptomyces buecherae]QNJ39513.1 AAA family ATPase [Streptomyces buecherae]
MPNYAESLRRLDSYVSARVPTVALRTMEQQRALRLLREIAGRPNRRGMPFWIYTRATGLRDLRTHVTVQEDRSLTGAMEFAATRFAAQANATVILVDPHDIASDTPAVRHIAELVRLAENNMGSVVLVSDTPVWSGLQRLGMSLTLDLPDAAETYEILSGFLADHRGRFPIEWDETDARRAAEFLSGTTETECVNLMATIAAKGSVTKEDVLALAQAKDQIFSDISGLERIHLKDADHRIGGLTTLRSWLQRRNRLIHSDLRHTNLRPPRGVLLVGVPGCGKSLSAKAIAQEWQLPLYRLDMGGIHGKYWGESEGNLRAALEAADRVAPCVLWIDEIEKGLAGGAGEVTGVGQRVIGHFLFWLQESQSRSFVVATANDVHNLPPELLRKGRFDELFFVDLPDSEDRKEIIELYFARYLSKEPKPDELERLIDLSVDFAGSDIESALHEVGAEALLAGGVENLRPSFVQDTFANTVPLIRVNPERIEEIRAWGRERAVPAGRTSLASSPGAAATGRRILLTGD